VTATAAPTRRPRLYDPYGRVWGHPDLRVIDGSLHVTNGGVNPVLIIFANAYRIMHTVGRDRSRLPLTGPRPHSSSRSQRQHADGLASRGYRSATRDRVLSRVMSRPWRLPVRPGSVSTLSARAAAGTRSRLSVFTLRVPHSRPAMLWQARLRQHEPHPSKWQHRPGGWTSLHPPALSHRLRSAGVADEGTLGRTWSCAG
jgi:GMC oxidoreductase